MPATPVTPKAPSVSAAQLKFFNYLFGEQEGYLCICTGDADRTKQSPLYFKQHFFKWPLEQPQLKDFLEADTHRKNVWFCTSLLDSETRKKDNCLPGRIVWSDLDACNPAQVEPAPSCAIQSSDYHFQAIWRLNEIVQPYVQEDFSKRIAYKYNANGADPTGWDLTQLLRVPFTFNYKYEKPGRALPQVDLLHAFDTTIPVAVFDAMNLPSEYKPVSTAQAEETLPPLEQLPSTEQVFYKYMVQLNGTGFKHLFSNVPDEKDNWSALLWKLLNVCFEAGMDEYEVFAVAIEAGCNKYARDNRPVVHLWEDVLRALSVQQRASLAFGGKDTLIMPDIVGPDSELKDVRCFVDDYYDWAKDATDAIPVYHELCGFMLLSSVMSAGLILETDFGRIVPNIWGLVLGDSTLTRKTTAMNMAMDMVVDVDSDLVLATDGTAEGMMMGLSERPGRTSIFLRDEVTGFFESINQKQYLAGMMQTMTQLYDVPKKLSRRLSKSTVTVNNPVFIFFGGGISDKTFSLVDEHYVISGFLPRFLVVNGEADLNKLRRIGRPTGELRAQRDGLALRIADLYERNNRTATIKLSDIEMQVPAHTTVDMTDAAYARYGDIEATMLHAANSSSVASLALPTFERLSRSILKMSILVAGSLPGAGVGNEKLVVDEEHVVKAATYVQRWGNYTIDLVLNSGKGHNERVLDRVKNSIERYPDILRGQIMRMHSLSSREATDILTTLEDRGYITITKAGKGYKLKAV